MQAETLNCPTCGAAVSKDATHCSFCEARLATQACPRCFAMMFVGSKFCPRCGARAAQAETVQAAVVARLCPRCRVEMETVRVGSASLRECPRCDGMWVDADSLQTIVEERDEQAAVLGTATHVEKQAAAEPNKIRYVPCPECNQLMNRINFAHCSGVVVDVCKGHGTWFDRDELQQIIEFIRKGGLDVAREREKQEIEEARRRLRDEQLSETMRLQHRINLDEDDRRTGLASAARELLKLMGG